MPDNTRWSPQPEHGPEHLHPGSLVAGVRVCHYHADTAPGLRTMHGSVEGLAARVAQISSQCLDCIREQHESNFKRDAWEAQP